MNILFYIEDVDFGGQQTACYHLLKNLDREKHPVYLAYMREGGLKEKFQSVCREVIQLEKPPENWISSIRNPIKVLRSALKLRRLLIEKSIDFVVTCGPYTHFAGAIGARLAGKKQGTVLGHEPSKAKLSWKLFHVIPLHRITDLYFGFSFGNKELASKGVSAHKLLDLINMVDTTLFQPTLSPFEIQERRENLGIQPDDLVISWIGRVSHETEIGNTLLLAKEIADRGFSRFKLLIVGDGDFKEEVKRRVIEYGIESQTIFIGFQQPEIVREFIQLTDISPLLHPDPIGGSKLREAMACGTLVLSVNGKSGFQAEWIHNMETGILVEPENFIQDAAKMCIQLADQPELRKKMAAAGRKYAVENLDVSIKANIMQRAVEQLY